MFISAENLRLGELLDKEERGLKAEWYSTAGDLLPTGLGWSVQLEAWWLLMSLVTLVASATVLTFATARWLGTTRLSQKMSTESRLFACAFAQFAALLAADFYLGDAVGEPLLAAAWGGAATLAIVMAWGKTPTLFRHATLSVAFVIGITWSAWGVGAYALSQVDAKPINKQRMAQLKAQARLEKGHVADPVQVFVSSYRKGTR